MFEAYKKFYPKESAMLGHMMHGTLPDDWDSSCKEFPADAKGLPLRQSPSQCLNIMLALRWS